MAIFPLYLLTELYWKKIIKKTAKETMTCYFYQRNYRQNLFGR